MASRLCFPATSLLHYWTCTVPNSRTLLRHHGRLALWDMIKERLVSVFVLETWQFFRLKVMWPCESWRGSFLGTKTPWETPGLPGLPGVHISHKLSSSGSKSRSDCHTCPQISINTCGMAFNEPCNIVV